MYTSRSEIFNFTNFAFLQLRTDQSAFRSRHRVTQLRFERNYIRPDGAAASVDYCLQRAVPLRSVVASEWFLAVVDNTIYTISRSEGGRHKQNWGEAAGPDMTQDTVIFPQCGKCDGFSIRDLDGYAHEFSIKISSGPFTSRVPNFTNFRHEMTWIGFLHILQKFHNYIDDKKNLFKCNLIIRRIIK